LPVGNILQDAVRFVVMVFGPKPIIAFMATWSPTGKG
jgi:hypothetical protein